MSYLIRSLDNYAPEEGKVYLFDANIWRFILTPPLKLKPNELSYVNFFDAIMNLASNPKCKKKPSIYINALIVSEVYNSYLRSFWDVYKAVNGNCEYKQYRSTNDCKSRHQVFISDFSAFKPNLVFESDVEKNPLAILNEMQMGISDFNDQCYYDIAKRRGFSIVTNDGDFVFQDVEIISKHSRLLQLI